MGKIIAVCTALLLAACSSAGTDVTQAQTDGFVKGQTTKAQVIAQLGPPQTDTTFGDVDRVSYLHMKMSVNGATFIPIVGLFAGGGKSNTHNVTFTFTRQGLLQEIDTADTAINTSVGK